MGEKKKRAKTPGSGRKKGTPNKVNRRRMIASLLASGGVLPLDYMLEVMRNPKAKQARRDEMARAAAPFLHARRAPEDKGGHVIPPMIYTHPPLEAQCLHCGEYHGGECPREKENLH